jgi:AraC-like DNA-binding protein
LQLASVEDQEVQAVRGTYANGFCALLGSTNEICTGCPQVQRNLESKNVVDTQTTTCFAGLAITQVPVKLHEKVIAFLQTGEVFRQIPSAKRFQKIIAGLTRRGVKVNLARLKNSYFHSRVVSPASYRAIVRLLEIFASHLALIAGQIALQPSNGNPPLIKRAKEYVANHLSDPIGLGKIARALNVSTFHFCRVFKQATGLTFTAYLNRVRIEKAKILLGNNDLRVSEIAYDVGFQTLTHFNRTFRKTVGCSPTEFRTRSVDLHKTSDQT